MKQPIQIKKGQVFMAKTGTIRRVLAITDCKRFVTCLVKFPSRTELSKAVYWACDSKKFNNNALCLENN